MNTQQQKFTEREIRELLKDYLQENEDHFGGLQHVTSDDFIEYVANIKPDEREWHDESVERDYLTHDPDPHWTLDVIDELIDTVERAEQHSDDDEYIVDINWAWINFFLTIPGVMMRFMQYIPNSWKYNSTKWIEDPTTHDYVAAYIMDLIEARIKETL